MKQIGKMRHRLTLQQLTVSQDAAGGFAESWGNVATLWARVEPLQGSEFERASAQEATVSHKITLRYNSSISREKRFLFGTDVFNIVSVLVQDKISDTTIVYATQKIGVSGSGTLIYPPNGNLQPIFESERLSFLTTQTITFTVPTDRLFYADRFEIVCEVMDGVVQTQPTFRLGITGNTQKYKADTLGLSLNAANTRQVYTTLLANAGETNLVAAISTAGALSSGSNYKGRLIVKGTMP